MATAKKTPSGKWKVRVFSHYDENKIKHYKAFTADTKKEAERLALEYKYIKEENVSTFEDKMWAYLRSKSNVLSPTTYKAYDSMCRKMLKEYPKFCSKKVITNKDVQELINDMAKNKKPKTVKNYNALVSVILGDSGHFKITLPQTIKPIHKIPTQAEFKELLHVVSGTTLEIPVLLGSMCMMRRSEICGLKISDIDGDVIHINISKVRSTDGYVEKTTKTVSSDRYIQAPHFVIKKIMDQGYVTEMTPDAITHSFRRLVAKIGLEGMRFHDLRHFGASYRHSVLNIPTAHIQRDGGWANAATLEQIYRHALDDEHISYSEKTNKAFEKMYDL